VVQHMVRTFLISMFNSGKRQKDAGHVRSAILKFKWVQALAPDTPPANWSDRELRRIQADGIRKLSQAAIAKDDKDYLKTMELLDELVYEYRGTNAGDQAARAMIKLLGEPETAEAYREVVRRQLADRKLRYARRLHAAQDLQNALIVYWDVSRDFPKTPAAETAAARAEELAAADAELVVKARTAREERDGKHWLEMARSFEMNRRTDKALEYLGRILKYYPDSSWAEKARAERDRLTAAKPEK
ncbi:MAG TPA: tetratricopeptide repeat protein, partial [Planctomycetota bacterium]|nr:tetratricopeptide repeat protein [Planctomycetota bacterium]